MEIKCWNGTNDYGILYDKFIINTVANGTEELAGFLDVKLD